MILDFSETIDLSTSFDTIQGGNTELYFLKRGFCNNCKLQLAPSISKSQVDTKSVPLFAWHRTEEAWECPSCGWWEYKYASSLESMDDADAAKFGEAHVHSAILRKFPINSNHAPIISLEKFIAKSPEKITEIHHKKMEELVASVFSEHYACDAHVVGKSNDGGIDIILIEAEHPTLVQVKRRTSNDKTESVSQIRELIGATLLAGAKDCIFVTTANNFTKNAIEAKDAALTRGLVRSFELFDRHKFIDCLQLKKTSEKPIYSKYLKVP